MLREIVFDTETTGVDPAGGDRVVEIGCVELVNHVPSGQVFHVYLNPQRAMPPEAQAVHGLSDAFLADKPLFAAIVDELRAFMGEDAKLVAHNAGFDFGFLNAELARTGHPPLSHGRMVDTLNLARKKHPNAPASLDALCQRYGIDNTRRTKHGALLDAELLAEVYLELLGGKQQEFGLVLAGRGPMPGLGGAVLAPAAIRIPPPARALSVADLAAHQAFVGRLGGAPIWRDYVSDEAA